MGRCPARPPALAFAPHGSVAARMLPLDGRRCLPGGRQPEATEASGPAGGCGRTTTCRNPKVRRPRRLLRRWHAGPDRGSCRAGIGRPFPAPAPPDARGFQSGAPRRSGSGRRLRVWPRGRWAPAWSRRASVPQHRSPRRRCGSSRRHGSRSARATNSHREGARGVVRRRRSWLPPRRRIARGHSNRRSARGSRRGRGSPSDP